MFDLPILGAIYLVAHLLARARGRQPRAWGLMTVGVTIFTFVVLTVILDARPSWFKDLLRFIVSALAAVAFVSVTLYSLPRLERPPGPKMVDGGGVYFFLGVAIFCVPMTLLLNVQGNPFAPLLYRFLVSGFLITSLISMFFFRLWRRSQLPFGEQALRVDPHPPVVLLRSFSLDQARSTTAFGGPDMNEAQKFDALIARNVGRSIGPLVALGNPDDYLPLVALGDPDHYLPAPGAARVYCHDETWQEEITNLLTRARLVLVVKGSSRGLCWELATIRRSVEPARVVFLTLPESFTGGPLAPWAKFAECARAHGFDVPESFPGYGVLLTFDDGWRSRVAARDLSTGLQYEVELAKIARAAPHTTMSAEGPAAEIDEHGGGWGPYPQGEVVRGRTNQEAVLFARCRLLGDDHPLTLTARSTLAETLRGEGQLKAAREQLEIVELALQRLLGDTHPATQSTRSTLAEVVHSLEAGGR